MKTLKELSKYTLARYQMGAADNLRDKGVDHGAKIVQSVVKGGDAKKNDPDREKRSQKMRKRVVGIGRAANKLTQKTNEDIEYIDEDEKKYHYDLGHKTAMSGDKRGETSDNFGPYASHYNAGYDAGMKKRKSTKPKVVGKDSYGRDIVKVEGHKTKKKYLKDLKMTMNQATLGDMSTALQKGGFQGKGQYEETEILEDGHTDVASAMSPEAKKRMQGIQRADDKILTKKILQRQKMGVSEGRVKQDMIKKGYARGNRDVDPRMMIPKTKPKDKQMKLPLKEKHMTDGEMEKREKIVMAMKPKMKGFKDRYGDDAKNVMYATATKMAMKKEDTNLFEKVKKRKVNQKKLAGNDKFEADPTLTSQIMRPDNPSNDNDNKI